MTNDLNRRVSDDFIKVQPIAMSGTMDNGLRYQFFIPGPFLCEDERQEMIQIIALFTRIVEKSK